MSWDKKHYKYKCSDGLHNSFWATVTESSQWKKWRKYALDKMLYDIYEVEECGWISAEHFQDFVKFIKQNKIKEL